MKRGDLNRFYAPSIPPTHAAALARAAAPPTRAAAAGTAYVKSTTRAAVLARNVAAGGRVIFAEGDSWFDFPNILLLDPESDVLDALMHSNGYVVQRISKAGDTVENMARPQNLQQIRLGLEAIQPDAFLFSGGGNDLCGRRPDGTSCFYDVLKPRASGGGINSALLDHYLDRIIVGYQAVLAEAERANVPAFVHSYGHAIPNGEPAFYKLAGPWLKPQLDARGYNSLAEGRKLVAQMIDRLSDRLQKLADGSGGAVTFVDVREAINDADWHDELHLLPQGWRSVADCFDIAITDALRSRAAVPAVAAESRAMPARAAGRRKARPAAPMPRAKLVAEVRPAKTRRKPRES